MRLLYAYLDFTFEGERPAGYHGFKKCELNFGTEERFHIKEPASAGGQYGLTYEQRPDGEKIEAGFWNEDCRLYNFSALVGDNGVGKTTLVHEILHILSGDHHTSCNYVILIEKEDAGKKWYLISSGLQFRYDSLSYVQPDLDAAGILNQVKLLYFSNTLTQADLTLWDYAQKDFNQNNNSWPLYNCSLISGIDEALRISGERESSAAGHLDTYYNFRSYQEARYVFDPKQRERLRSMRYRDNPLPVPIPQDISMLIRPMWRKQIELLNVETYSEIDRKLNGLPKGTRFIISLCLNCVWNRIGLATFDLSKDTAKAKWFYQYVSTALDNGPEVETRMGNMIAAFTKKFGPTDPPKGTDEADFQRYIDLLWNNRDNILEKYFQFFVKGNRPGDAEGDYYGADIHLGEMIPLVLEVFMIHFVNLTRAVGENGDYFVVYNWGLSSGESNLLHLFTKLRYLLNDASYYPNTPSDKITEANARQFLEEERNRVTMYSSGAAVKKTILKDIACDSLILFFDEPDLTFHPEWQRQYILILSEFLVRLFPEETGIKDIQVILGTHSPIMLGDFPEASVQYLRKTPGGGVDVLQNTGLRTFGENIYTILQQGFYLKNGAVGAFAQRKIQAAADCVAIIREALRNEKQGWPWRSAAGKAETTGHIPPEILKTWLENLKKHERLTVQYLPEGVIRGKLRMEIEQCRQEIEDYHLPREDRRQRMIASYKKQEAELREQQEAIRRKREQLEQESTPETEETL